VSKSKFPLERGGATAGVMHRGTGVAGGSWGAAPHKTQKGMGIVEWHAGGPNGQSPTTATTEKALRVGGTAAFTESLWGRDLFY